MRVSTAAWWLSPTNPFPHQSPKIVHSSVLHSYHPFSHVTKRGKQGPSVCCLETVEERDGFEDTKEFTEYVISSSQELSIILDVSHSICIIYEGRDSDPCDRADVKQKTDFPPMGCWENRTHLCLSSTGWASLETKFPKSDPVPEEGTK